MSWWSDPIHLSVGAIFKFFQYDIDPYGIIRRKSTLYPHSTSSWHTQDPVTRLDLVRTCKYVHELFYVKVSHVRDTFSCKFINLLNFTGPHSLVVTVIIQYFVIPKYRECIFMTNFIRSLNLKLVTFSFNQDNWRLISQDVKISLSMVSLRDILVILHQREILIIHHLRDLLIISYI